MQFPESWLREFCNPPLKTQQLADTLTMAGLEVEDMQPFAPAFTGVVVAEVLNAVQHPNADRLRVCTVNIGQSAPLTIVCGAPNARPGIRVPCAMVGAVLPPGGDGKPFHIKLGKIRGVESQGMLCSSTELGVEGASTGLMELPADATVGANLRDYLSLDDTLFTLKLTPNLAHCLSVYGVARELSALTGSELKAPSFPVVAPSHGDTLSVSVSAPDLCGRFSGRIIRNVNPEAKTPDWIISRLQRCGQRSVNALVDISNYVMFELGRPTHIFDLDTIHGSLDVRWARAGEQLKLLNGNTVQLDGSVGVIADDKSVESLAGIMGGDATAVSDSTRNIYVEAAFWWPQSVAGRSRKYNFSTDAGHRFERGVDPGSTVEHIEHITRLIQLVCGGDAGPVTDAQPNMPSPMPVEMRVDRAVKVLGMLLTETQCIEALRGLGLEVEVAAPGVLRVTPPSYRFDIQIEEDLIEEVARVVGYDNLPQTPPQAPITAKVAPESIRNPYRISRLMAAMGYQETINFSFVDRAWEEGLAGNADPIELVNPIASQMSVMRSTLLSSLLNVARFNLDRRADRVCIFEVGRVFHKDASVQDSDTTVKGFHQPMRLGGLAVGQVHGLTWEGKKTNFDFYDIKGHVEQLLSPAAVEFSAGLHPAFHPGRCAVVMLGSQKVGHLGELHPKWCQTWGFSAAPVMFELDLACLINRQLPVFEAFSKIQSVERDISVWVNEAVTHAELMTCIHSTPIQPVLRDAYLFDVYRPSARSPDALSEKSVAIRLVLKRDDAVLTEQEIDAAVAAVVDRLGQVFGARLRA